VGGVILGLTMVGVGVWWWRRPGEQEIADVGNATADVRSKNYTFNTIITQIVRLDEAYEQGLIKEDHSQQRRELLLEAKKIFPDEKFPRSNLINTQQRCSLRNNHNHNYETVERILFEKRSQKIRIVPMQQLNRMIEVIQLQTEVQELKG
jgi:hypothetical protein